MSQRFELVARVSTENQDAVRLVLHAFLERTSGTLREEGGAFVLEAVLVGKDARELNRKLLSALRKAEKRTRLRAQRKHGTEVDHFFDYVLKRTVSAQA
jgi:hypothetical protein